MRLIEHALQFNSPLGNRQRVTVDTVLTEQKIVVNAQVKRTDN